MHCWRIITTSTNYVVKFTIHSLFMDVCAFCGCDAVQVFNGYSESSSSIGKFCYRSWPIASSGRYLFVKFTSDGFGVGAAFSASFKAAAKGQGNFTLATNSLRKAVLTVCIIMFNTPFILWISSVNNRSNNDHFIRQRDITQ